MEIQKSMSPKTTQVKLKSVRPPISYTQSNMEPPMRTMIGRSRNINARAPSQPVSATWLQVKSQVSGMDPTAPHLKYGVFPQRRAALRGVAIRTVSTKPVEAVSTISDYSSGKKERKKTPKKSILAEAPLFVFRTLDKDHTRHLSQSEILHVDIKPLRNPPLSSNKISISPTFSMSPSMSRTSRSLR